MPNHAFTFRYSPSIRKTTHDLFGPHSYENIMAKQGKVALLKPLRSAVESGQVTLDEAKQAPTTLYTIAELEWTHRQYDDTFKQAMKGAFGATSLEHGFALAGLEIAITAYEQRLKRIQQLEQDVIAATQNHQGDT